LAAGSKPKVENGVICDLIDWSMCQAIFRIPLHLEKVVDDALFFIWDWFEIGVLITGRGF
jgi:hypothetical protein